jgi:hypothetical protein
MIATKWPRYRVVQRPSNLDRSQRSQSSWERLNTQQGYSLPLLIWTAIRILWKIFSSTLRSRNVAAPLYCWTKLRETICRHLGQRWSSQMKEAASSLLEDRPSMSKDVYENLLALGSYNDILSKMVAKTWTSLILTSSAKFRLGYWAHIHRGRKGTTSAPIKKILGRASNLLKRKEFSIGMTDSQRIITGVQSGDGWRISLLFLLAVSRQHPDYIAKTLARNTGGYLERGRGHGNLWAPRIMSDQLADCGVFMSNARDAGYGLSFHLESLVCASLSVNDESTSFPRHH